MGYETLRNIHIETGDFSPAEISREFTMRFRDAATGLQTYVSKSEVPHGVLDFDGIHPRPWYAESEEMKAFSIRFPSAEILISGQGEEPEDAWEHRYRNGKAFARSMKHNWTDWQEI